MIALRSSPLYLATLCVVSLSSLLASSVGAQVGTVRFATGLSQPVYLDAPVGDLSRVFVAELTGTIRILDRDTGAVLAPAFLSLPGGVSLLGMAFHPDFANNGYTYVYYNVEGVSAHVVRYSLLAGDPDQADPASAFPILDLAADGGHVGGWLGFGPNGLLRLNIGDNATFDVHDPLNNAQSITGELFGNTLRIDVDGDDFPADANRNYAIPASNPFASAPGEGEIWAYGLRNPWRSSFDRATGDFVTGDVGQVTREEINFERADSLGGRNYGWRIREGTIATPTGGVGGPQPSGGIDPVYDYAHGGGAAEGFSITGGYVYRGPVLAIQGAYFFADFVSERIWSVRIDRDTGVVSDFTDWTTDFVPPVGAIGAVVSFGEDAAGHLYLVDFDGEIYRVDGPAQGVPGVGPAGLLVLASLLGASACLTGCRSRRR